METLYGGEVSRAVLCSNLKRLTNQIFRLLPANEEGEEWQKPLETLIIEFSGLSSLLPDNEKLFTLTCKLQGLKEQGAEVEFQLFRRTVFECCSLAQSIERDFN